MRIPKLFTALQPQKVRYFPPGRFGNNDYKSRQVRIIYVLLGVGMDML